MHDSCQHVYTPHTCIVWVFYLCVSVHHCICLMPTEARKKYQVPGDWSYRQLWTTKWTGARNWTCIIPLINLSTQETGRSFEFQASQSHIETPFIGGGGGSLCEVTEGCGMRYWPPWYLGKQTAHWNPRKCCVPALSEAAKAGFWRTRKGRKDPDGGAQGQGNCQPWRGLGHYLKQGVVQPCMSSVE